jgi:hypothetical protein
VADDALQLPVGASAIDAAVGQRQLVDIADAAPDGGLVKHHCRNA